MKIKTKKKIKNLRGLSIVTHPAWSIDGRRLTMSIWRLFDCVFVLCAFLALCNYLCIPVSTVQGRRASAGEISNDTSKVGPVKNTQQRNRRQFFYLRLQRLAHRLHPNWERFLSVRVYPLHIPLHLSRWWNWIIIKNEKTDYHPNSSRCTPTRRW